MKALPNFLSVKEYAKRCGIQTRSVYIRIRNQTVAYIKVDGFYFIESQQSPTRLTGGYHNQVKLAPPTVPDDINLKTLFWVHNYSKQHKVSIAFLYEQIFTGYYKGVLIGGKLFVDATSIAH